MGKLMGEPGARMEFEEDLRQVHVGQSGEDVVTQRAQAGGFLQLIEPCERQRVPPVDLFHADGRIGREVGGGAMVRGVELVGEGLEFRLRRFATTQRPADLGPEGLPRRRQVEEDAGALRAEPGAGVQPSDQAKHLTGGMKVPIAIAPLNVPGMVMAGAPALKVLTVISFCLAIPSAPPP